INYEIYQDSSNLEFLYSYFRSKDKKEQKSTSNLQLELHEVNLKEIDFRLINHTQDRKAQGVDFSNLDIHQLSGNFTKIQWDSTSFRTQIKNLHFSEKSGFQVNQLNTRLALSD